MEAWTDNNDGKTLPNDLSSQEHSGAIEPEMQIPEHPSCEHDKGVTFGELPGGRKIKHCILCGRWTDVEKEFGEAIGEHLFGGDR